MVAASSRIRALRPRLTAPPHDTPVGEVDLEAGAALRQGDLEERTTSVEKLADLRSRAGRNEKKSGQVKKTGIETGAGASVLRSMYSTYDRMIQGEGGAERARERLNVGGRAFGEASGKGADGREVRGTKEQEAGHAGRDASHNRKGGNSSQREKAWKGPSTGAPESSAPAQLAREKCGDKRDDKHEKVDPEELRMRLKGAQKALHDRNGGDTSDCTLYCSTQGAREGREGRRAAGAARDAGASHLRRELLQGSALVRFVCVNSSRRKSTSTSTSKSAPTARAEGFRRAAARTGTTMQRVCP